MLKASSRRVLPVCHAAYRTGAVVPSVSNTGTVVGIFRAFSIGWQSTCLVCVSEVLTYRHCLADIESGVYTSRDILEVGIFQYTVILLYPMEKNTVLLSVADETDAS